MEHIHLFQHIGGGCLLVGEQKCDDSYECECGAKFTAYSSQEVHFQMPHYIAGKEPPEPIKVNTPFGEVL